jgi:hypothetical protein
LRSIKSRTRKQRFSRVVACASLARKRKGVLHDKDIIHAASI